MPARDNGDTWRETFVSRVSEGASVSTAARDAGVPRSRPYRVREADPEFAAAWASASGGQRSEPSAPSSARGKARGRSGTVNTGGYIDDAGETNYKLKHPWGLVVYDEMRRTEASIRWMLAIVQTPLRAASWDVEPASQDPEDLEVAAFVEHALKEELDGGFDEFLRQALTYLDFGHSVFERVAELREVEFTYEVEEIVYDTPAAPPTGVDGEAVPDPDAPPEEGPLDEQALAAAAAVVPTQVLDPSDGKVKPTPGVLPPQLAAGAAAPPPPPKPKPKRKRTEETVSREAFVLGRLAPRLQRTIEKWNPDPRDSSKLASIEQFLGDGMEPSTVEIEADRLLVFTHEKEGDDWRGVSLLRAAYKAYRYKMGLENAEAIGIERSVGLPVAYPPDNADDADLDAVEAAISALRQGEQLYIVMPGPKASPQNPEAGWTLEDLSLQGDGGKGPDIDKAISRYDAEMARNVIAEFMRLGHEQTGARATGDVQQDPYYQALEAHAGYVEDVLNAGAVRPLVDWNYEVSRYPKIRASKLQARNLEVIATALAALITSGGVTADPELENFLRRLMDAPERPREMSEEGQDPDALPGPDADAPEPGEEGPAPGETGPEVDEPAPARKANPFRRVMDRVLRRDRGEPPELWARFSPSRVLRPEEEAVAFDQIIDSLDNAEADLPELVTSILEGQARSQAEEAQRAVDLNRPELLEGIAFDPGPLERAIAARLEQTYQEGRAQVRAELRRQGVDPSEAMRAPLPPGEAMRAIAQLAKATAEEAVAQATRAVKAGALRKITSRAPEAPEGPGSAPLAAARQAVREAAKGLVSRAFGLGRERELRELAESFDHFLYTAILDENNCGPCEDADGIEAAGPDELDPPTPNPECEGGDRCRCMWVGYVDPRGGRGGGVGLYE